MKMRLINGQIHYSVATTALDSQPVSPGRSGWRGSLIRFTAKYRETWVGIKGAKPIYVIKREISVYVGHDRGHIVWP